MSELIGGLVLDEELAAAGLRDVNDEERRGWSAVHWRTAGWPDIGLKGRINEECFQVLLVERGTQSTRELHGQRASDQCSHGVLVNVRPRCHSHGRGG